ncbi:MAG: TetR/AcrR family transcriptional regulator [Gammaproteobacteria bacterium]
MSTKPSREIPASPVTVRASRMDPEARRRQLIAAALRTFAARGIGETSHSALAREAGVAVPTAFHYFESKEALVDAVLAEVSRFLLDELLAGNDNPSESAPKIIADIHMAFCDAIESHPDHIRVWLEWSVSIRDGLWESYLEFYRAALAGTRTILERGQREHTVRAEIDIDDAARVIVALAHMTVQMKFSGATREQVDHTLHSLMQGYLQTV